MCGELYEGEGSRRVISRKWCIPLAMVHDPGDRLEGDQILAEVPGAVGLLLWWTARDVTLWAAMAGEAREHLFADGSADSRLALLAGTDLPAKLSAPLDTLHRMLVVPGRADGEIVALCCLEVAAWARGAGLQHTAIWFAQAGALAAPEFSEAALHVGVYARAAGQGARAETWLRRAVAVARRERNGEAYASALAELGALYDSRGIASRAEHFYRLSFRAGRRFAARAARMRAAHGLFRLARQRGDTAAAEQFALVAQKAHLPDFAGSVDLVFDLARFWIEMGNPARARAAVRRLGRALVSLPPAGELAALALMVRARAEPGHPGRDAPLVRSAWTLLADEGIPDAVRYTAATDLAHAARIGGDLRAFRAARRAVLRLAPQAEYPAVAERMAELWPEGESPRTARS